MHSHNKSADFSKKNKININKKQKLQTQTSFHKNAYNPNLETPNLPQNLKEQVLHLRAIWIKNNDQLKTTMQSLGMENYQQIIQDALKQNQQSQTRLSKQNSTQQHRNSIFLGSPSCKPIRKNSSDKQWLGSISPIKKKTTSPRKSLSFMINQDQQDPIREKDEDIGIIIDEEDSSMSFSESRERKFSINQNNNFQQQQKPDNQIEEIKLDFRNRVESEQLLKIESQTNIINNQQNNNYNNTIESQNNININLANKNDNLDGNSVLLQSKQPTARNSVHNQMSSHHQNSINQNSVHFSHTINQNSSNSANSPFLFHQKSLFQQSTIIQQNNNNKLYESIIMAKQNIQNQLIKKKSEKNSQILQKERIQKRKTRRQGFQNLCQNKALTYIEKVRPQTVDYLPLWIRTREDFLKLYYKQQAKENLEIATLCSKPTLQQVQKLTSAQEEFIKQISKNTLDVNTYLTEGRSLQDIKKITDQFMSKCDCFKNMKPELSRLIATYLEVDVYWKNQIIEEDKNKLDNLYIVYDGKLALKEIKQNQNFNNTQQMDKTCLSYDIQYNQESFAQQQNQERKKENIQDLENNLKTYFNNIEHFFKNKQNNKQNLQDGLNNSQLSENKNQFINNFYNFYEKINKDDISEIILNIDQLDILNTYYHQLESFFLQEQIKKNNNKQDIDNKNKKQNSKSQENFKNFINNTELFYKNLSTFFHNQEQYNIIEQSIKNKVKSNITKQIISSKILKTWSKYENTPTLALNKPYDISSNHFLVAQEQTILISIKQNKYQELVKKLKPSNQQLQDQFKNWNPFFTNFDTESLKQMIKKMEVQLYFEGDTVYRYLDEPDYFYYIHQGQAIKQKILQKVNKNVWPISKKTGSDSYQSYEKLEVFKRNKLIEEQQFFGEEEILLNLQRKFNIIAQTDLVVFTLKKHDFHNIFNTDKQKNFFNQFIQKQNVEEDQQNQNELKNKNLEKVQIFTEGEENKNALNYNQIQEQKSQYNKKFKKLIKNAIETSYSVNLTREQIELKKQKVKGFISYLDEIDFTKKRNYKPESDYEQHQISYRQLIKN